jgi:phosphatidylinositol-3,4,5-trisphosphate 3-phosphatase/dual-specificity protein phosphatase PTEN
MISCYFVYSQKHPNPFDAIEYFSSHRCIDGKGVTIPSQKRYVEYFADFLNKKQTYKEISLFLKQIELQIPNCSFFNSKLNICLYY